LSYLVLSHLTKRYDSLLAVNDLSLEVEQGEFISLLGPSGCGKTTTLRMVAGFIDPTAGEISVEGQRMNDLPSHRRNMGVVFQNYALFPHMTVGQNVAFGLEMRRVSGAEIGKRVAESLALVGLQGLEARYPRQLSGGQQQRVALARAIVISPSVLLLDEPLSSLDAKLRAQLRVELRRIQKEVGIATIFVTHDQEEALTLSDRVVVMHQGRAEQVGVPREIFDAPRTRYVADFMGYTNFLPGRLEERLGRSATVSVAGTKIRVEVAPEGLAPGAEVTVAIRPEHLEIKPGDGALGENEIAASLEIVTYEGIASSLTLALSPDHRLVARSTGAPDYRTGDRLVAQLPPSKVRLFSE
jgi:ABC-type Fe3+/spermidine/putrescine transport system ATPase subunit